MDDPLTREQNELRARKSGERRKGSTAAASAASNREDLLSVETDASLAQFFKYCSKY